MGTGWGGLLWYQEEKGHELAPPWWTGMDWEGFQKRADRVLRVSDVMSVIFR